MSPSASAGKSSPTLIDTFLHADATLADAEKAKSAREGFDALVAAATPCQRSAGTDVDRGRCVVEALFSSGELTIVGEPGDPASSAVTSVLVAHRGNCAALTATVLALAERVGVPIEAVVFPRHVVVGSAGDEEHVFELLDRGVMLTARQIRSRLGADGAHGVRVRAVDFPSYYLDNLAVRFADAGDPERAQALFEKAIHAGPRVARVRFNYGTFLLGRDQLNAARTQLHRAVRLDSNNAPAWANLGVTLARLGKTGDARKCFERALGVDPHNALAAENLKVLNHRTPPPRP